MCDVCGKRDDASHPRLHLYDAAVGAILIFTFIVISCSVTTETNNSYYSLGIDPEQACILKDYYLENNKTIPESVKKTLDENNIEC